MDDVIELGKTYCRHVNEIASITSKTKSGSSASYTGNSSAETTTTTAVKQQHQHQQPQQNQTQQTQTTQQTHHHQNHPTPPRTKLQRAKPIVVYIGLGCAVASSAVAIAVFQSSVATMFMGVISIINASIAVFKDRKLGKIYTLRTLTEDIRQVIHNVCNQLDLLTDEMSHQDFKQKLINRNSKQKKSTSAKTNAQHRLNKNIDAVLTIMSENKSILRNMKERSHRTIVEKQRLLERMTEERVGVLDILISYHSNVIFLFLFFAFYF